MAAKASTTSTNITSITYDDFYGCIRVYSSEHLIGEIRAWWWSNVGLENEFGLKKLGDMVFMKTTVEYNDNGIKVTIDDKRILIGTTVIPLVDAQMLADAIYKYAKCCRPRLPRDYDKVWLYTNGTSVFLTLWDIDRELVHRFPLKHSQQIADGIRDYLDNPSPDKYPKLVLPCGLTEPQLKTVLRMLDDNVLNVDSSSDSTGTGTGTSTNTTNTTSITNTTSTNYRVEFEPGRFRVPFTKNNITVFTYLACTTDIDAFKGLASLATSTYTGTSGITYHWDIVNGSFIMMSNRSILFSVPCEFVKPFFEAFK